jgi:translation elongation factor EF-Tu-like GTPase
VELQGTVSLLAGTCPAVTFTAQSTKVSSSTATVFDHVTCGTLKNDAKVVVKGSKQADGSVLATSVSFQDSTVELQGTVSLLAGTCPAVTFTVQSTKVSSGTVTVFDHITCGTLKNGSKVEVKGSKQADGSVLATTVALDQ